VEGDVYPVYFRNDSRGLRHELKNNSG